MMSVPEDAVIMKALCGIKPEVKLLLSSGAYTTIAIYVSL